MHDSDSLGWFYCVQVKNCCPSQNEQKRAEEHCQSVFYSPRISKEPSSGLKSLPSMPSNILATAGYDHTIRLWEVSSGYCYRTLQYQDSVRQI